MAEGTGEAGSQLCCPSLLVPPGGYDIPEMGTISSLTWGWGCGAASSPIEMGWGWGCCVDSQPRKGLKKHQINTKRKKRPNPKFLLFLSPSPSLPFIFQVLLMATGGSSNPDMGVLA